MAEETKRQAEESGAASEEMKDEAQTSPETEAGTVRDEAEGTPETASEETSGEQQETTEDPAQESAQEDDVVDGDFVSAEEAGKKSSFFRRKKDKRDEKIEELTDKVKRQMAEFDNFRKRTDKEKSQMFDFGAKSVIEKILPVIDNFERGLQQAGENPEDPFVQGMEKIYKQMLTELESIGVKPIEAAAHDCVDAASALYIGRGLASTVCYEGALKLKEISYIHAEAYAAGEMKHGPIALLHDGFPVVAVATASPVYDKTLSNLKECESRGAKIIAVATDGDDEIGKYADHVLYIPKVRDAFMPITASVVLQLFARAIAVERGCDVDQPRNLAKSVTVE
jgi:molecular chaperone GrpE (heat shock protein)